MPHSTPPAPLRPTQRQSLQRQRRQPGLLQRLRRWLRLKYFHYELTFGAYVFDWWEKAIIAGVLLGVTALFGYGLYRQALIVDRWLDGKLSAWLTWNGSSHEPAQLQKGIGLD